MKMQSIKLGCIKEMLNLLPADELEIVECLRSVIGNTLPTIREKLSYNVPFYFANKRIAYIWPGSIPWGNKTKKGVELGFCYGSLLSNYHYLEQNERQQVSSKRILNLKDINSSIIEQLLLEAFEIDKLHKT